MIGIGPLLTFAFLVVVILGLLLWRLVEGESGRGFIPMERDLFYDLVSMALGLLAVALLALAFIG